MRTTTTREQIRASFQGRQEYRGPARALLRDTSGSVFTPAENLRSWSVPSPPFDNFPAWCPGPLAWRIWDDCSQSQLTSEAVFVFEAADLTWPLRAQANRAAALETHASHANWIATPMVSATMSAEDLLFRARRQAQRNRGQVRVSLIDLGRRWRIGLPMLHAEAELKAYGVPDPYQRAYQYYRDEVLCLWGITQKEVVHTWLWEEIAGYTAEELRRASQEWYDTHDDAAETTLAPTPSTDHLTDLVEKMSRLASASPTDSKAGMVTPEPRPPAPPTMSTGSWILLNLESELLVVRDRALAKTPKLSPLPLFRLTHSCLPEDARAGFDTAYLGTKGGVTFVVATCHSFLLCWNMDMLQEGKTFPSSIKRYEEMFGAQNGSIKKGKKYELTRKGLGMDDLVKMAAMV